MKKTLLKAAIIAAAITGSAIAYSQTAYRVTTDNRFYTVSGNNTKGPYNVTGIANGQNIVTLNARPEDGSLYAVGYDATGRQAQLYRIVNTDGYTYNAWPVSGNTVNIDLANGNIQTEFINGNDAEMQIETANGSGYVMDINNGDLVSGITPDANSGVVYPNDDLQGNIAAAQSLAGISAPATTDDGNNGLLVYPNPVITSTARIVLPEAAVNKISVELIDMNGRVLRSYEYPAGSYRLDMDFSRVPTGMYNVRVYEPGVMVESLKVIRNQ